MRPFIILVLLAAPCFLLSQEIELEVEGGIKVGDVESSPEPGTIRWTGSDFEGWNGLTWVSLTGNKEVGTVFDIDSNEYKTVRIGDQVWMAENLRTTRYQDSTLIGQETDPDEWKDLTEGAWCWFNNDDTYDIPYGKLYNWYAANSAKKICPEGWYLPGNSDWITLRDYLGGEQVAGGKMKEPGLMYWSPPNEDATNSTGFTGVGGGIRQGTTGAFEDFNQKSYFWNSQVDYQGFFYELSTNNGALVSGGSGKDTGVSVRCIKMP